MKLYILEQTPQMCERLLGVNLVIVQDILPLDVCLGMSREWGGAYPLHPPTACLVFSPLHPPQNLKKSWHPQTLRNVEKVWKAEQKHEAERKKIEELQRELREERAREEMQRYAEDVGAVK